MTNSTVTNIEVSENQAKAMHAALDILSAYGSHGITGIHGGQVFVSEPEAAAYACDVMALMFSEMAKKLRNG